MMSGLNPDEGLLFYLCNSFSLALNIDLKKNYCLYICILPFLGIHYENMAKMSSKTFLEQELVPGVIASMIKNASQLDSIVKIIQEQYFGNIDYSDSKHFVPRFSQVL